MGDVLKFSGIMEYKIFEWALYLLFISEGAIWVFTWQGGRKKVQNRADNGTLWLIIGTWVGSIIISILLRSKSVPGNLRGLLLPHFAYYIGIFLILLGIVIRCSAVWTLKRAFTHSVQTTGDQHLIQTGLYKIIRNPAYTGSILSLLGVAFAYRQAFAPFGVLLLCLLGYGTRIRVEEAALAGRFKEEFQMYCSVTKYRLLPFVY